MSTVAAWITTTSEVAAFTSGPDGTLTGWNRAAERLLQINASEVMGHSCHEVVAGHDQFGNLYCGENCPIRRMARRGAPICPFRLDVGFACDGRLPLYVSIVVVGGVPERGPYLVHLLEPVFGDADRPLEAEPLNRSKASTTRSFERLTPREVEVLRMIGTGAPTDEVAVELGISYATVRNHVQSCLRKLEAHNRIEAVRLAERLGLLEHDSPR
jgi:DNA-binding CsgD family transcriptional regulator